MYDPLGLSIGTTNLVAAGNGGPPVTRRAVLTLYPHCAPKIGVPSQNPNLIEPGALMSGFVERIGDAVALVSPDGSVHDPDLLLVEALDAMVLTAGADASSSEIAIAVPAHWKPGAVHALRNGLRTHVGFVRSGMAPRLVSDAIAALTAVNSELGLPHGSVVGLLDFGGSATYVTLVETKSDSRTSDFQPVSATARYQDFSGSQIDQALLLRVIDQFGYGDDVDPASTAAVGQLGQLREQCRAAKERLSTDVATELFAELAGCSSSIEMTREQLEDLIQDPLTGFIYAFDDMLARHNASWADLAAVVTVGGGANIPLVTQRLSFHTRRPVLTASQPGCAAAMGALLLANRGGERDSRTRTSIGLATAAAAGTSVIELPAGDVMVIDHEALTDRELAWSQTDFPSEAPARFEGDSYNEGGPCWSMRLNAVEPPKGPAWRRIRVSQLLIGVSAVVAMTAIGGVALTLTAIERRPSPLPTPIVPGLAPMPPGSVVDVEMLAERYRGSRGIRNARIALDLVDPGAESPRETWLRLLLIRAGFPRPQTQIPVYDEYGQLVAVIDMGWAGIKVGVDYEGDHHRTDRRTFNKDIKRAEALTELGWTDVRVTVEDTEGGIIWRVSAAWQRRT